MTLRTLDSLGDLAGRRVFVRCDFNVPLDGDGRITDDGRVRAALPTLKALVAAGAQVIAASHLGRPKGIPGPAVLARTRRRSPRRAARTRRRVRDRHRRIRGAQGGRRLARERPRRRAREPALQRGRDEQGRRGAPRLRRAARGIRRCRWSPTASASYTASTHTCTSSQSSFPRLPAELVAHRGGVLDQLSHSPSAPTPSCSADRRSQTSSA